MSCITLPLLLLTEAAPVTLWLIVTCPPDAVLARSVPAKISPSIAVSILALILFSVALVVAIFVSSVVYQDSVLITVGSPVIQALSTFQLDSWFTYKFCSVLSFRSLALIADPG